MQPSSRTWRGPLVVGVALLLAWAVSAYAPSSERRAKRALDEKYEMAKALFAERCKSAGVVIKRTVKDVEGIELLKVRPELKPGGDAYFDPMFEGAAMADEVTGDGYVESFLLTEYRNRYEPQRRGQLNPSMGQPADNELPGARGYRYVEARDPVDGQRYRYELPPGHFDRRNDLDTGVVRRRSSQEPPRYAIDYEDILDPADRAFWIAGTKLKVIDRTSGEVIAQLTRYVWDSGMGSPATGRWPWQHASSLESQQCPVNLGFRSYVTRYFVDAVLIPRQGD